MARITFAGQTIHVSNLDDSRERDAEKNYILIQCEGDEDLTDEQYDQLRAQDIELKERQGANTYLCRNYGSANLQRVQDLDFVKHVALYHSEFKISPDLKEQLSEANNGATFEAENDNVRQCVSVVVHDDPMHSTDSVALHIEAATDAKIIGIGSSIVTVEASRSELREIASIEGVESIELFIPSEPTISYATAAVKADRRYMPGSSGFITDHSFDGEGEVIAILDSGFDKGTTTDVHPNFQDRVLAIDVAQNVEEAWRGQTGADFSNHGTPVAGCAISLGVYEGSFDKDGVTHAETPLEYYSAPAPKASLHAIKVIGELDPSDQFKTAYEKFGARIVNRSIGLGHASRGILFSPQYGAPEKGADRFVWRNRDMLIVNSAGNQGGYYKNHVVDGVAAAKNVLTVGSSTTIRGQTAKGLWNPSEYCGSSPALGNRVVGTSSRGPTTANILKPDVVAPGHLVVSTRSRWKPSTDGAGKWGNPHNPNYKVNSGTSFATPLVAGIAVVLRQALIKSQSAVLLNSTSPTASLLKALIVNGAVSLEGSKYESRTPYDSIKSYDLPAAPNGFQGHGLVNLQRSLLAVDGDPRKGGCIEIEDVVGTVGATSGTTVPRWCAKTVGIVEDSNLSVTLVYPDADGKGLQNKISLLVTVRPPDTTDRAYPSYGLPEIGKGVESNVQKVTRDVQARSVVQILLTNVKCKYFPPRSERKQLAAIAWFLEPKP